MLAIARRRGELMRRLLHRTGGHVVRSRQTGSSVRELLAGRRLHRPITTDRRRWCSRVRGPARRGGAAAARRGILRSPLSRFQRHSIRLSMQPAADAFGRLSGDNSRSLLSTLPFYSNRDGAPHSSDGRAIWSDLAQQIAAPVHFGDMIERMYADGVRTFVEVGPRDVLTSLVGSILDGREHQAIALDRSAHDRSAMAACGRCGKAWARWQFPASRWTGRNSGRGTRYQPDLSQPSEPKFSVPIDGGNYGRPYPPPGGAAALPPPVTLLPHRRSPRPRAIPTKLIASSRSPSPLLIAIGKRTSRKVMRLSCGAWSGRSEARMGTKLAEPLPAVLPDFASHASNRDPALQTPLKIHRQLSPVSSRAVLWQIVAETRPAIRPTCSNRPWRWKPIWVSIPSNASRSFRHYRSVSRPLPVWTSQHGLASHAGRDRRALDQIAPPQTPASTRPSTRKSPREWSLWQVVADKTGYPADMLEPAMALEADLGIDSIKRVEIFSALQERFPQLAGTESDRRCRASNTGRCGRGARWRCQSCSARYQCNSSRNPNFRSATSYRLMP